MEWLWIVVATTVIAGWLLAAAIGVMRGATRPLRGEDPQAPEPAPGEERPPRE